jgi:hypothetical protein
MYVEKKKDVHLRVTTWFTSEDSERNQENGWKENQLALFRGRPNVSKWIRRELAERLISYYASPDIIHKNRLVGEIFV